MTEPRELAELHEKAAEALITLIEDVVDHGREHAKPRAMEYVKAMSSYAVTRAEHDDASRHPIIGGLM